MAEQKVAVIDSIEERYDSKKGWGKYTAYLEGDNELQKLDVPADLNALYDLKEGYKVTLVEGPFSWIVHENSECFTGMEAPDHAQTTTRRRGNSNGATATATEVVEEVEAPKRATRKTTSRSESKPSRSTVAATPKEGASEVEHTPWNAYQISQRDPQMRIQSIMAIVQNQYQACIENNIDVEEGMQDLMDFTGTVDAWVNKYLKL